MSKSDLTTIIPSQTRLLDRYIVTRVIGEGGFATVFEALDSQGGREVAIKVLDVLELRAGDQRDTFVKRFEREARLTSSVRHPHITQIFDFGTYDARNLPFIVMEKLHGEELGAYLSAHGPMAATRLFPLFIDVLRGLAEAHDAGIVHRDLKPSNLFLKDPGTPHEALCIMDFGIARLHTDAMTTKLTKTDNIVGTPNYVAPEYITEQIVSPALDVYQMGLILVEALTGGPVVKAKDPLVAMFQHVHGQLDIPRPLLDSPLAPLLQRAMTRRHLKRWQHAREFADALEAFDATLVPALPAEFATVKIAEHRSSQELLGEDEDDLHIQRLRIEDTAPGALSADDIVVNSSRHKIVGLAPQLLTTTPTDPLPSPEGSSPLRDHRVMLTIVAMGVVLGLAGAVVLGLLSRGSQQERMVRAALQTYGPTLAACYRASEPGKTGQRLDYTLALSVSAKGRVERGEFTARSRKVPGLEACVLERVPAWTFPTPPEGKPITVKVPLSFGR